MPVRDSCDNMNYQQMAAGAKINKMPGTLALGRNIDPVKIYLYNDGIVRFATKQYSMKEDTIDDKYIHLTNYSVNKRNEDFTFNESPDELTGHKWSSEVQRQLIQL